MEKTRYFLFVLKKKYSHLKVSVAYKFTIFGISFGFLFPLFSTLAETWMQVGMISLESSLRIQASRPLLWVIDSAPFFLGFFAWLAGIKQEAVKKLNLELQKSNKDLKIEIARSSSIERNVRDLIDVYKEDLHSAKLIQEFSLPEIPSFPQFKIHYKYLPLNPVGGDLISLQKINNGLLGILVGDVVGHGISAALIASLVNVLASKNREKNGLNPKEYLEFLNKEANQYLPEDYYFTALYGLLASNGNSAKFTFSRGGHPYPFIYSHEKKEVSIQEISGTPLGLLDDLTYSELSVDLFPKDRIYIITDGLIEVKNDIGKLLGSKNFSSIIANACSHTSTLEDSIEFILNTVDKFSIGKPVDDDRFILGIEIQEV